MYAPITSSSTAASLAAATGAGAGAGAGVGAGAGAGAAVTFSRITSPADDVALTQAASPNLTRKIPDRVLARPTTVSTELSVLREQRGASLAAPRHPVKARTVVHQHGGRAAQ